MSEEEKQQPPGWFVPYGGLIEQTHTAIYGDNGDGLKVKVALNTQCRNALARFGKWLVGTIIALCVLAVAILAIVL